MEGVIVEGDKNVGAETGSGASLGVVLKQNGGSIGQKRIELMHPGRGLSKLVCQNIRDLCSRVLADAFAGSTGETVSHSIVQKIVGVEVDACCSMKTEWVPGLLASARGWRKKGQHCMPGKGIREGIMVEGVKDEARDEAGVERERHGRQGLLSTGCICEQLKPKLGSEIICRIMYIFLFFSYGEARRMNSLTEESEDSEPFTT